MALLRTATLLVTAALACGSPPPEIEDSDGGSSSTSDVVVGDHGHLTDAGDNLCERGKTRCAGGEVIETCGDSGLEWVAAPCPWNMECVVCTRADPSCDQDRCRPPCEEHYGLGSVGCTFITSRQEHRASDAPDAVVVANGRSLGSATVEFYRVADGTSEEVLVESVSLGPRESRTVLIDTAVIPGSTTQLASGGVTRVSSDTPIIAFQHSPYRSHVDSSSSLLLPDRGLGRTYVVPSHRPFATGETLPSYFEVIALHKDTSVVWTSPVATAGQGAKVPPAAPGETVVQRELNRYDRIRVAALADDGSGGDLSGTVIRASNPVRVVAGSGCARDEPAEGPCDSLQEGLIPVSHWATEYVAVHPPLQANEKHYWRVYAGDDDITFVTKPQVLTPENCAEPAVFEDGECTLPTLGSWVEIEVPNGESFVVKGKRAPDDAVMVVGYLQSEPPDGERGASPRATAMYPLIGTQQYLKRYAFQTPEGYDPPRPTETGAGNYIQVVREQTSTTLFLDGEGVHGWEEVGEFEVATVRIAEGSHVVESNGDFGLLLFGFSGHDPQGCFEENGGCASSYAYPGGLHESIVKLP
ncbi:MAG: IgGFc-binding protein [Myxococcota bacterium]